MRLTKEKAEANRTAIVEAAGRLFRERGFDAVTVADLMDAAGFTHGGFYNHFPSKEALAEEVVSKAIHRSLAGLATDAAEGRGLAEYVRAYLSAKHRDDPARGCTIGALAGDSGRQGREIQACMVEGLEGSIAAFVAELVRASGTKGKKAEAAARVKALRLWSELVGALVLSRAVASAAPVLSEELLDASRGGALADLGADPPTRPRRARDA